MIFGIGTDLATVSRMERLLNHFPQRALEKILAPEERGDCGLAAEPARFLAKRFAAKEALAKALGTGVRDPVLLPAIEITHDTFGRPGFRFHGPLADWVAQRQLTTHLSLSDEGDRVLAFVITEAPS